MTALVTALALAAFLLSMVPAIVFLRNLAVYRPPPRFVPGDPPQSIGVSVLIPARNEEAVISRAVEAALASRGLADLEVLVLDDHSEDATAEIVRTIAARDGRLKLLNAPELPAGWCGKQHACAQLARQATKPFLLFVDADVALKPEGLARLLRFQQTNDADLVSGIPGQLTGTWMERLLIPLIHFILLGFMPMWRMRKSRHPAYAAGCGQLFLARRSAYEAMGGHAVIRTSLHDGIKLPRAFRRAGFFTDLCDATELADCRMYQSASAVWSGLAKNATEGLARPVLIGPASLILLVGQTLPFLLWLAWPWMSSTAILLNCLATLFAYLPRFIGMVLFRQSRFGALLHPLGILLLVAIQWYGLFRSLVGGSATWKGRAYPQPS